MRSINVAVGRELSIPETKSEAKKRLADIFKGYSSLNNIKNRTDTEHPGIIRQATCAAEILRLGCIFWEGYIAREEYPDQNSQKKYISFEVTYNDILLFAPLLEDALQWMTQEENEELGQLCLKVDTSWSELITWIEVKKTAKIEALKEHMNARLEVLSSKP